MILRETGWLLAAGLVAGGALSAAAIRLITSRLYGLSPSDPLTFGVAISAPGTGGAHRHVAAGLARLARRSAGRASLRVGLRGLRATMSREAAVNQALRLAIPLVVLASASAAPAADGPSALLLALNKGDHTLAIVDATTLQVLGKAASGPDPHEVVGSADGRLAYISNYTAGNGFANSLSVVDLTTRKALPPIDLGSMSRPHGLVLAGGKIYFTAEGSRAIGRYDPATRRSTGR